MTKVDLRTIVAVAAVLVAIYESQRKDAPAPAPAPQGLVLKGLFVGPTASDDAVSVAGLTSELADELEWDMRQPEPKIVSGQAWDDLRVAAREQRMRGVSIGARQPNVKAAIHKYLDEHAGVEGGPLDDAEKLKWIAAYRDIARAAEDASK